VNSGKKSFTLKPAVSFTVLLSFLVLAFSGIIMFLRPEGSIARWTGWTIIGLNKQEWEGLHTLFAIIFTAAAAVHLYYNWRILLNYCVNKFTNGLRYYRELSAAAFIVVFFIAVVIFQIQPFWKIVEFRSHVKDGDYLLEKAPPVQDIDKMPVTEVAKVINVPVSDLVEHMRRDGYVISDTTATLRKLAELNRVTPEKLFLDISDR